MAAHGEAISKPPSSTDESKSLRSRLSVLLLWLIPPTILAAGWLLKPVWAWVTIMVLLAAFTVLVGYQVVDLGRGAFVDTRNKISLSRFQTVLWILVVIAGFLVAAMHNVRIGATNPLRIAIPQQLWALLGISVTALVGSGLIKGQQATKERANKDLAEKKTDTTLQEVGGTVLADGGVPVVTGVLTVNAKPADSRWMDMFEAEQVGANPSGGNHLEMTKIQMFYFTIILVFAYAVAIATMLSHANGRIGDLPALDNSMVALLGISSAAYLTGKGIPKTDTSQDTTQG
jgi:hypothetical protein